MPVAEPLGLDVRRSPRRAPPRVGGRSGSRARPPGGRRCRTGSGPSSPCYTPGRRRAARPGRSRTTGAPSGPGTWSRDMIRIQEQLVEETVPRPRGRGFRSEPVERHRVRVERPRQASLRSPASGSERSSTTRMWSSPRRVRPNRSCPGPSHGPEGASVFVIDLAVPRDVDPASTAKTATCTTSTTSRRSCARA